MATQYDIDRATYVRQEYRYATALNAAVKSRNASAMSIQINTQLDQAAAEALAAKMLADGNQPRVYEIEVEGIIDAQTLVGGVPTWIVNTIQYAGDSKALKLFSLSQDYENNRSTIRVRG